MPTKLHNDNLKSIDDYFIKCAYEVSVPMAMRKFKVSAEAAEKIIKNAMRRRKNFDEAKVESVKKKRRRKPLTSDLFDISPEGWKRLMLELYGKE